LLVLLPSLECQKCRCLFSNQLPIGPCPPFHSPNVSPTEVLQKYLGPLNSILLLDYLVMNWLFTLNQSASCCHYQDKAHQLCYQKMKSFSQFFCHISEELAPFLS